MALVVSFDDVPPEPFAAAEDEARRAAFSAAGVGYCTLNDLCGGDGGGRLSLQSLDRFMSLVAGCPGPVAVQHRRGGASGVAGTHLAALMLRRGFFECTGDAMAWMQVRSPPSPPAMLDHPRSTTRTLQ